MCVSVGDIGVRESVYLKPGRYEFQAWVRAQGISTDEGVAFRVAGEGARNRLSFTTEAVRGTTDWKLVRHTFKLDRDFGAACGKMFASANIERHVCPTPIFDK